MSIQQPNDFEKIKDIASSMIDEDTLSLKIRNIEEYLYGSMVSSPTRATNDNTIVLSLHVLLLEKRLENMESILKEILEELKSSKDS